MNIQSILPIILLRQKARLFDSAISYMIFKTNVTLRFTDFAKISFIPTLYLIAGIFPITIFDVTILDMNKGKYQLVNISNAGYKKIISILKNYPSVQVEYKEKIRGVLINGLIRFL